MFSALIFLTATMNGMSLFRILLGDQDICADMRRLRWVVDGQYQCSALLYIVLRAACDGERGYWHCLCYLPGKKLAVLNRAPG